jgi:cytochrome c oxidase subunit 1
LSILTGLNFIVSIHKLRAPGMTWYKMPLFLWATYATSLIQILATPVLGITMVLLAMERAFGIGIFDPTLGGDPVLFQHFFWFYSHPAVYIMILPGMGVASELISVHSRREVFGYTFVAYSSVAIALVGFLVWGHHMFVAGQSELAATIFSFLTFFIAIPSGVKVWNWLATLYKGSIALTAPMLWALAFLFLFTIGGLTGIFLGMLSVDIHLHDTYFVVAHFHYVMVGGTIMALLSGLHYWFPKMSGRMYPEKPAAIAFWFILVGFNVTFFPQFILGAQGMPRRYWGYLPEFTLLNQISTFGSWLLAIGFVYIAIYLWKAMRNGPLATANPWSALTLEWQASSPPPHDNFANTPVVTQWPYEYRVEKA